MRLPVSKVYRGFPELDGFSDEDCERFVAHARRSHAKSQAGIALLSGGIVVGGIILAIVSISLISKIVRPPLEASVGLLAAACVGSGVLSLMVRDRWLRSAIRGQIILAQCMRCGYSLLGLNSVRGRVLCPECGRDNPLGERGLTPAGIMGVEVGDSAQ